MVIRLECWTVVVKACSSFFNSVLSPSLGCNMLLHDVMQAIVEDDNSNVLPLNSSEPVVPAADLPAEQSPTSPESPQPDSTPIPSPSTVEQPVPDSVEQPVLLNSAAEVPTADVSLPMSSQAGDELVQQSSSEVVVLNSAAETSAPSDNDQMPEPVVVLSEPVIPSGAQLAYLKKYRRQSRQLLQHGQSTNGNNPAVLAIKTNGTVVNGVDSPSPRPVTDDTAHVGTWHKYHKRYDIAAPDHKDKCCVVM